MRQISNEAHKTLNDPALLTARDDWFARMWGLFEGERQTQPFLLNGRLGWSDVDMYQDPESWVVQCLENLAEQTDALLCPYQFRPLCVEAGFFGVHFVDRMFGAKVWMDTKSNQWYNQYLTTPVGMLELPDLERDETWALARRVLDAFLEQDVRLPLFGLPTIASALNIAVNLYGEEFLVEIAMESDAAIHDLGVINQLLCMLHTYYRKRLPAEQLQPVISWVRTQPPGFGQLCGCTSQLISSSAYRKLIAPLDDALLRVYSNGGMIHLCGVHTQHINCWRDMQSLRAIQINDRAAHDLKAYFDGLRTNQIIYLEPCVGMTVAQAMQITGGQRLVILGDIPDVIQG